LKLFVFNSAVQHFGPSRASSTKTRIETSSGIVRPDTITDIKSKFHENKD